ncbi:MAG: hypothetical protein AAGJ83_13080, partial [Planctomycetota bacterium]
MSEGRFTNSRRGRLHRLIERLSPRPLPSASSNRPSKAERLRLETLESRQLLAGDFPATETEMIGPIDVRGPESPAIESISSTSTLGILSGAEGEA